MYAKTVLKNTLAKWGILSVTMQCAIVADQAVIKSLDKPIDDENVGYPDAYEFSSENGNSSEETELETEAAEDPQPEKETVPANGSSKTTPKKVITPADIMGGMHSVPFTDPPKIPAVTPDTVERMGKGRDQLFGADEDAAMQEAYEQHVAGTMGPNFDRS
jgi:hypothetical protein